MLVDILNAMVEFTKAAAWPVAVVIVVNRLGPRLGAFLESLANRKVGFKGFGADVSLEAPPPTQTSVAKSGENPTELLSAPSGVQPKENAAVATATNATASQPVERLPPTDRPALNALEEVLQEQLESIEPFARVPPLMRALAETRLNLMAETTYRLIFGTQIIFMRILNVEGQVQQKNAYEFFQSHTKDFPNLAIYGFDKWLQFLKERNLVEIGTDGVIKITDIGRDFLVYITKNAIPDGKPW